MSALSKRTTIYFNPDFYRALRIKAAETEKSLSGLVNEAIQLSLAEDQADLAAFKERAGEPSVSFENALKELKLHGKL